MILVTGSSGFIGSNMLDFLSQKFGQEKIVLLSSKPNPKYKTLVYENLVLDTPKLLKNLNFSIVIHLGAFIPKESNNANDINGCFSNIISTKVLADSVFQRLQKFIFISTVDVYPSTDNKILETIIPQPISLYGHSKLFCEKMILNWGAQNNIDVIILRVGHVFGPGEHNYKKLIPEVIKNILRGGQVTVFGDGTDIRSFIYVDDISRAILSAIDYKGDIKVFNLVSADQFSILEIVNEIIKISGKNIKLVHKPSTSKPRNLVFDNSLMVKYLYKPQVNFRDGLKNEFEQIKSLYD
jgi:UDP-glucose 4-epimerase